MCFLLILLPVIIFRNTTINNSLRGLRFLFRMLRTSNIYLGLFTRLLFTRLIAIYSPWKIYSMFPPTYISCDYCCVAFVSFFINLRHPRDLTSHTSRRGTLYIYINVFFWPFGILPSSGRGSFPVLSAPWHAESPPGPRTQVWVLAEVRGTCSGGPKWQVRSGRDS